MKISRKLFIGFSLVTFLAIMVGTLGIMGMQRLRRAGLSMYEKQVIGLESVGKASVPYKQLRLECRQVIISSLYDDLIGAADAKEEFEVNKKEFEYWMNESYKVATTDELIKFHDKIMELYQDVYLPYAEKIMEASMDDIPDHVNKLEINVLRASAIDASKQVENLMIGLMDLNAALAEQTSLDNAFITQLFIMAQYILLAITVIVAAIAAVYIVRSIAVPINEASDVLGEIAKGNFDARVEGNYKGDLEQIKNSVNDTALKLSLYLNEKMQAEHLAYEFELEKVRLEAASEAVFANLDYASKIQKNLLPEEDIFNKAFSDYSLIWEPRDIVSGDVYWIKNFEEGTVLCVCDCTGHGTSGALLTMLVAATFETTVKEDNYKDTAGIIWKLEKRLVTVLHVNTAARTEGRNRISEIKDGCDLAVLYIGKDGSVTLSAGNIRVFICDGKEVAQIKGQKLHIGEGRLKGREDVQVVKIPANHNNKFYIASDGLYEQVGGEHERPFGYKDFKQLILEHHEENQAIISERIWEAFEKYRGGQIRRDDVELITFQPKARRE